MKTQNNELFNKIRSICRKLDILEDSINTMRQSSDADDKRPLIGEYESEYYFQLECLNGFLMASPQDK